MSGRQSVFVVLLTLINLSLSAQVASPPGSAPSPPPRTDTRESSGSVVSTSRIDRLEHEVQLERAFQDRVLNVVFWALGTLATLAALLVGFGWYANFRVYERDRAALERELRSVIGTATSEQAAQIASALSNSTQAIQTKTLEIQKALEQRIKSAVESAVSPLHDGILSLEYDARKREADEWRAKAVYPNVVLIGSDLLSIALKEKYSMHIGEALDCIIDGLKLSSQHHSAMDQNTIAEVQALLARVPSEHSTGVQVVQKWLGIARDNAHT